MKHSAIHIYIFVILLVLLSGLKISGKEHNDRKFTVVVDAGHGGKDIGATDNGAREKDINLGVALQLESLIKKKLKDANVVMTRDDDTYLTLQQRADIANKAKGDLFISIHTNSVDKSNKNRRTVSGSSVYALGLHKDDNNMAVARRENSVIELEQNYEQKYSGFDPSRDESYIIFEMAQKKSLSKSIKFAEEAQKQLVKSGRNNRGVHQAGFWVLWATSMPSVLVELDFICNPTAAAYLSSGKGQKELAEAIFKAVENYCESWMKMQEGHAMTMRETASVSNGKTDNSDDASNRAIAEIDNHVVVASSKVASVKTSGPSGKVNGSSYASGKRRRRGDQSRSVSDSREVETKAIPLHSEAERKGRVETVSASTASDENLQIPVDKKDKKKNDKKKKEKEKKAKENKTKRAANAHNAKVEKFVTVYKIQLLASAELLKQNNPRFCGLSPVSTYKENNLYKYYYGESQSREEINKILKEVVKLIPDAFVVSSMKSVNNSKN